jgi:hypothetical protein
MSQPLDNLTHSLQDILKKEVAIDPGGDLESLIEENLAVFNRQFYESCLQARQPDAPSAQEGFPPSGVPERVVLEADATSALRRVAATRTRWFTAPRLSAWRTARAQRGDAGCWWSAAYLGVRRG